MDIYVCITESLCCTPETNTTLEINYTLILKKADMVSKHLVLSKTSIRHLVHKMLGPRQNVLEIWSYPKLPGRHLVHAKRSLIFWSRPKPFGMDQICSWMFWIGPNFKGLLAWTKCLMDILDRTKCPARGSTILNPPPILPPSVKMHEVMEIDLH